METILAKMGDDQIEFEKLGGFEIETNAKTILGGLGIFRTNTTNPGDFSSGWKMRIALARVLIALPDLILMDEPTNYLDMETILWLEDWLLNFKGAILMTTHDRIYEQGGSQDRGGRRRIRHNILRKLRLLRTGKIRAPAAERSGV